MRALLKSALTIAFAGASLVGPARADVLHIDWNTLGPAPYSKMEPHRPEGSKLATELDGKQVEISGFLLPVDREGDLVYEFLLFPWAGACSHTPPPPPNQVVHIWPAKPFKMRETYQTVSITGTLKAELEKTQFEMLDGIAVVETGYSIGRASVIEVEDVGNAPAAPVPVSPWKFLKK